LDAEGHAVLLGTSDVVILDGSTLAPTFDAPYIFTVEVFKPPKVPQAYSIPVYLVEERIPVVFVSSERGAMQPNGAFKINVNDQLVLEGGCETELESYELSWNFDPHPQIEILGDYNQILAVGSGSGAFIPGNQYTAVLTCVDSSGSSGHSALSLIINSPPTGPPCAVCKLGEPDAMCTKTGAPIHDTFRYSCASWSDEDLPLQYKFGYSGQVNGQYQEINFDWGAASTLDLTFPSGTLNLSSVVRDVFGAESEKMYDKAEIFTPIPLVIYVDDMLQPSGSGSGFGSGSDGLGGLEHATFEVYRDYSSLEECKRSLAQNAGNLNCGNIQFSGEVGAENAAFSRKGAHLVVIRAEYYYAVVAEIDAVKQPIILRLSMLKYLPEGQDRVVLSWDHSGDLDLWIDATWGSGEWDYVGYLQPNAGDGDQSIALDLDSRAGADGPESTLLKGISAGGSYEVWVNVYEWADAGDTFTEESINSNPATVDIFCSDCYDEHGVRFAGMVKSVTQSAATFDRTGAAWWKVGEFTDLAGHSLRQWKTCTSNCYWDVRMVRIHVQAFKLVGTVEQLAVDAEYTIYSNFSEAYLGCEAPSYEGGCGKREADGVISASVGSDDKVPANKEYLISVELDGFHTIYVRAYVDITGFRTGHITILQKLEQKQNQVVLNWAHDGDLDLGVMSYLKPVGCDAEFCDAEFVNYENTISDVGPLEGDIELLVSNSKGHEGPETTILQDLPEGYYEVWINVFEWQDQKNCFTKESVESKPATVNVFCSGCYDEDGHYRSGLVASITQSSEGLPDDGASWWKVGEFVQVKIGEFGDLSWQTCRYDCYSNFRMVRLSLMAYDILSNNKQLDNTALQIYSEYPDKYDNCEQRSSCGQLVTESDTSSVTYVPAERDYLVVAIRGNYYSGYFAGYVGSAGGSGHLKMVPVLAVGQNRVVLSWDHSGDLDLWIDATWDSGEWDYVGYLQPNAGDGDQSIALDLDSRAGADGPETTRLEEGISAGGRYEVWVNVYEWADAQDKFIRGAVLDNPATVDIFCYSCQDDLGYARSGRVKTVVQSPDNVPFGGVTWWKVGEFKSVLGSSGLRWHTCTQNCYTSVRKVHFSVKALELLDVDAEGERLDAQGARYQIYSGYPESYLECEMSNACGTLVAEEQVGMLTDVATDHSERGYLTVISLEGYYVGYFTSQVSLLGGRGYSNMVRTVGNDQARAVLRWDHNEDLDLWIDATWGSDSGAPFKFVYYDDVEAQFGYQSINLQRDSTDGISEGPETVIFEGLTEGLFELWVNIYGSKFTADLVGSTPATVDIFCDFCLDDEGTAKVGRVATVTQDSPEGDAAWWKVGEFRAIPFGFVNLAWTTCTTDCFRGSTRMFAGGQDLIVHALYLLDGSELLETRIWVFEDYGSQNTFIGCDPTATEGDQSCGTLTAEGGGSNPVQVPPDTVYRVVVSVDGFYYSYKTVYVPRGGAEIDVNMIGILDTNQDRVVLQWEHAGDLDLWVKASWGPAEAPRSEDLIGWDSMFSNDGDSSIILDVDNLDGFAGPETTRFETLIEGVFEVWVNIYSLPPEDSAGSGLGAGSGSGANGMYTIDLLNFAPARMDIYCASCLLDRGEEQVEREGIVTSVTQNPADLPADVDAAWWKVGVFRKLSSSSKLTWQTCVSECYSDESPESMRRRSLSWVSEMVSGWSQQRRPKHAVPRKGSQHKLRVVAAQSTSQNSSRPVIVNETGARPKYGYKKSSKNHSQISSTKISRYVERPSEIDSISLKKPTVALANNMLKREPSIYANRNSSLTRTSSKAKHLPKRAKHTNSSISAVASRSRTKRHKAKTNRVRKDHRSIRKLLQFEELNSWADAEKLLRESLDRQDYFAINMMSSALSQEIDARLDNFMVDSHGAAEQKAYILRTLTEGLDNAFKTEGFICEVLSVSQTIALNPQVLMPENVQALSGIVKTILTISAIPLLRKECAESVLDISSKALDGFAHNRPCSGSSGPDDSDPSVKIFVNDLESSMKLLARKQIPDLISGQTRELMAPNWSSQLTKHRFGDILGRSISLIAAAAGQSGFTASYKLPPSIIKDVDGLRSLTEISVQFETFHNAPRVNGIQPVSPLVSLTLSDNGQEIPVSGLTDNVEVVIPIVNQARCENTEYPTLVCMYWDPVQGSYSSDGCFVKRLRAGSVTCSCNHLTSIVLVPGELPPTTSPAPTTSQSAITTTTPLQTTSSALSSTTTPAPSAAPTTPALPPPAPEPTQAPVQTTPRPIAGPQIAIGVDADTYRFVDLKRVGIYAGYVEFYISISPNKILNVTTNGITPTCGSPVVGSSSVLIDNREISELAQGGMAKVMKVNKGRSEKLASAIKAIFCDSGAASDISSHTYELGPGHMVEVTMTLSGPIVASDLNDQAQNDLLKALADIIGLDVELMEVVSVRDPRRRLLTVQLTLGIVAKSAAQGEEIKAAIANADIGALMAVVGWSNIEVTDLETIVKAPQSERSTPMPSTPMPSTPASKVPIIVAAVVGSTLFLGITVAVLYFVLSRRRAAQLLSEKRAVADSIEEKISDLQPPDIETMEETEIGTETETEAAVADFNRDIQLMENFGPEVMRLVKGRRNMNVVPAPMEASADFVHPDLFQPAMDTEDIEMRSDSVYCNVC